jgi:hypothetical protein
MEQNNPQTNITLQKKDIDQKALYYIDWSKLEKVEDLITILACIGFSFSPTHPYWNMLERFVDLDSPIIPNQAPERHELKLPKLTTLK